MIWTRPRVEGQVPTGRYGHSTHLMGEKLIIYGGWGRGGCQCSDDIKNSNAHSLHVLDINQMTWYAPRKASKKQAKHVFNHGACVSGKTLLTFGGFDGRQSGNDFIMMNLDFGSW